jgi:hypothetical protein
MGLRRIYKPFGRCYVDAEGHEYPSVTSILGVLDKPFLSKWKLNMMGGAVKEKVQDALDGKRLLNIDEIVEESKKAADLYRDERGALGTRIHSVIEKRWNKQDTTDQRKEDHKLSAVMFLIEKWIKDHELEPLLVEAYLLSEKHRYAGACDLVANQNTEKYGSEVILVDYKTGKSVGEESQWQLAAYCAAYHETYNVCPDIAFLLHIDYDHQQVTEELHLHKDQIPEKFQEFLAIYGAFRAKWRKQLQGY